MEESEKVDTEPIPTNDASPSQGKSCALCGCATPAVRCDRCNSQIFCLSCDDMYHRHPKRKLHLRKAVDSIWTTARSPRLRRRTELPGDPCKIPIPPPRSKKREHRTIGGRTFLKSGLELGSFGHSKVFSPASKDFFAGQKSPASMVESNCDDGTPSPNIRSESGQIYENDNITNATGNLEDRSPWNPRPNISSPIQVSIPSSSPDIVANGQSFGYPAKPHSQSAADLTAHTGHPVGHHPYHFHPPYPPYMHPPMHPYSHSMAHLNCAQCISSSWSNLISPHPSPYFHPMPWGSAQNTLARPAIPGQPVPTKHSHGDLTTYPDSGFHYPYPGAPYFHNGPPVVDPNFIKDLHEQAEMQKQRKEPKSSPRNDEMDTTTNPSSVAEKSSSAPTAEAASTEPVASTIKGAQAVDETPAAPVKPTEPWTCIHCTYINPPGIHICEVCCKTSYGNKPADDAMEEQSEERPDSRYTDSPLVNRDALLNSPGVSEIRDAQKDFDVSTATQSPDFESREQKTFSDISTSPAPIKLTTETQTFTTTKTTDVQTQNITRKSMASSTDSIFPRQEMSVQTEIGALTTHCSVATDPMISSQSLESLLSGVSAPPYHNRRAGWGRGATSFSTQSLYERGRSRSPIPRSLSFHTEAPAAFGRESSFASEEAMHSASQAWLYADPMYYKPHNRVLGQPVSKEDYFDGTWGSMDKLNKRVKHKKDKEKLEVRPKFHRSLDDLKPDEKKPEFIRTHELMMLQTVKEAERCGFTLEDLHVAYLHCGKENPVYWLEDNWPQMIKNVIGLAAKYGEENEENDVGAITTTEAKEALRIHRGDIWDAVAECIENRQRKILELTVRGNFTQKQIVETLKNNEGNVELAYADLLRSSTRRHKFILSPGLSTDSEDLNVYNPTEDSAADHNLSVSPMKASKLDVSVESKSEKKKSDFLTKLTAIREAQSERRKAREEKELIRETITQDVPITTESEPVLRKDISIELTPSISREDSKEVEEIMQSAVPESEEISAENKLETEVLEAEDVQHRKETVEDSIPVDFDTNWSESQGEWIEEYSDEHWEEGDEHWVGLGKKFQKMQKEFEEEAAQMAALWEKEELEDDVFEEETKVQQEAEPADDRDKKFDDWVKANLKADSLEYEEETEMKGKPQEENIAAISIKERLELEGSQPSPLQHYPTALDLSLKSQFESDWVDLPADAEIEKLAHDIVCEGSDIENKFDESEMAMYEEEKAPRKVSDQGSDEDWEKIEMDEQLQEVTELDHFAFPEKEEEIDRAAEEEILGTSDKGIEFPSELTSEITIEKDATVLYKNLESVRAADASDVGIIPSESPKAIDTVTVQPKPPERRKSKLSSTDIDEALKNQSTTEISTDIPPPLPEKSRHKGDLQKGLDTYAIPDKAVKDHISAEFDKDLPSVPQKPPRLNLSPTVTRESKGLTKEGSPITSLSYESDSNFFADSESETEMKLHRPKNMHKKLAKYENELEESEIKEISVEKLPRRTIKEKKDDLGVSQGKLEESLAKEKEDILEPNLDFELDDDIDPSLIEPLPRMTDIDYDPELPILLGGRGRQISEIDDVDAPKAFREDTTRPLQLFKAVKKESSLDSVDMPAPTAVESPVRETSFIQRISNELPMPAPISNTSQELSMKLPESIISQNEAKERLYYNEPLIPQQTVTDSQVPQLQPQEQSLKKEELVKETESIIEAIPTVQEEELPLPEIEALSAVADYFFGRYNEVTVTPAKKKTSTRARPLTASTAKSPSKVMSTSEIASVSQPETTSQMDQSAAAILQEKPKLEDKQDSPSTKVQQKEVTEAAVKKVIPPPEKPKPPPPVECLSFAEDYLFGCYNQVVPTRKTKNVPVVLAKIPTLGELQSSSRPQTPLKEQKLLSPISTPEPLELPIDKQEEEEEVMEEDVPEEDENDTSIRTDTSATYDDVFHDLPSEMLSNQSFDESSIYYESFQDAVEDVQGNAVVEGNVINVKSKSVHFEEAQAAPAVPPRRKTRGPQKGKAPSSTDPNESYANEYLFRQYEIQPQAKKKLPFCSQDFRMNQGLEPTEIPSDTSLTPEEEEEEPICSETSVEIPLKSNELLKPTSECDFGDSEQPLDLIEHHIKETNVKDTVVFMKSSDSIPQHEDNSLLVERKIETVSSNLQQDDVSTDVQSEKSESFEELSIPDNLEEIIESCHVSGEIYTAEKKEVLPEPLPCSITEPEVVNIQQIQTYDTTETSNRLELDQFVFIEQAQDIIDDSYNLYDIQGSLVCDLNYVDVKGNIEDECTDDSEQEWKRNEDRKNTLNASFLANTSIKKVDNDEKGTALDENQQYDQQETTLQKSQNEMEIALTETQKSDTEMEHKELKIEELKIAQCQDERKITEDQNLVEDFELTESIKEDIKFSEQSEDICIESQSITTETYDAKLSIAADTIETKVTCTTDEFDATSENICYDTEKIIGGQLEISQDINDDILSIEDEYQIESFEKLTEKIDENLLEIEKELYESVPYEYDDVISEELNITSSAHELDDAVIESFGEETEISETDDMTMTEETKISEIADDIIKEKTKLEFLEIESEVSYTTDTMMDEESYEEKIDETSFIDEDKFLSEDQQIYVLEDFEASVEMSDDNVSTHSSVSTEIAVSMKIAVKESEGDECSLNLEQIDNFEDDGETPSVLPTTVVAQKIEDSEQKILESDLIELEKKEVSSDIEFSKEVKQDYDAESAESDQKLESEESRNELLTPIPFMYDPFTDIYTPKVIPKEPISDENLKPEEEISDVGNIIDDIADEDKITSITEDTIKDHVSSPEDYLYTEGKAPEIIEITESERQLNGLENDEIGAAIAEESVMSHFYDEWYQSAASTEFSFLSAESIYAKFGKSESSESGNESDTALSTVDFKGDADEIVVCKSESSLEKQVLEKDIKDSESDQSALEEKVICEEIKYNAVQISQELPKINIGEIKKEVDISSDLSIEFESKSIKDEQQIREKEAVKLIVSEDADVSSFIPEKSESMALQADVEESVVNQGIEISSVIREKTESVILQTDAEVDIGTEISSFIQEKTESVVSEVIAEVPIQPVKDQDTSDLEKVRVSNKFSTSKSCQTEEDNFEEDVFFDSFDDTFTIPSYIHLPIESQTKPSTSDISVQCELISIEDILSSKKILNISQTEVIASETHIALPEQGSTEESKLRGQQPKVSELASEEKEESSCESFEDSDSDIFIESPSSQDELDVGAPKRGLLYAEVDSDTGFSSGSECGWTKKTDYKQKDMKKVSQFSSTSKVISLQKSVSSSEGKEITVSVDSSGQENIVEMSSISEKKMAADIVDSDIEIFSDNERSSPLPPEIIERAITPVAIPQFPSFEEDVVFVEVKEDIEEITDNVEEEVISATCTTPTVEYFYGPLPETVKIDSPPDSVENFFETASELSESASFSFDKTESFSDSSFSLPLAKKMSKDLYGDNNIACITKAPEDDESFAETLSSLKGETEDSTSEYYSVPESVSLLSRGSLTESDIFDFAQSDLLVESDYEEEKAAAEKIDLAVSEINKMSDLTIADKSGDKQLKEMSNIDSVSHVSQVAECKKVPDDEQFTEKKDEILSVLKTASSTQIKATISTEEPIDSKTILSTEEAKIFESTECEFVTADTIKLSSDVPPVPSDVVKYLYYDDIITFDDESYHTQSESVGAPSLSSQEVKVIDSADKVTKDEIKEKISTDEVCTLSSVQTSSISEEKIAIPSVTAESESILGDELAEKSTEMHGQDFPEISAVSEIPAEKTETIVKLLESTTVITEKRLESEENLLEKIPTLSETDLKFPSVEVLPLESAAILPAAAEQTFETVVCKKESIKESVLVCDTSFQDASPLAQDQDVEQVDFQQTSSEIPPVPSDIVRYLYYDDDITFDEMTQSSFHSQYEEVEGSPLENIEYYNVQPSASDKFEVHELIHEKPHLIAESDNLLKISDISLEELSNKPDSASAKDESHVPFDSLQCHEDWFDLKETTDVLKCDSEQYSTTRSSALKEDSEPPCIPKYILSPKLSDDIPVGKNDVDEVTDISTHFTMTDDSDRFSDIENDISLNFEEEYVLPDEVSDQIDQLKDDELFESCMKSRDYEMYINTACVEGADNEFQFFTPEQLKEIPVQEIIIESTSPKEITAEQPKEQLKESMTSVELDYQQIQKESKLQHSILTERSDEKIISADSPDLSEKQATDSLPYDKLPEQFDNKEIDQLHISYEFKEKLDDTTETFDECITSISEVSKDEFAECLTSSVSVEQKSDEDAQKKIETFYKDISASGICEISKEQFVEPLTSSKLSEEKVVYAGESSPKQLSEQLHEYIESDENGNFPELIVKEIGATDSIKVKDSISSETLELSSASKILESSSADKNGENEISGISLEHSVYSEPSYIIPEKEVASHKKLEINLQNTKIFETISSAKDDLETSRYETPIEESQSVSAEITDNWSDADGVYIEEDQSIYDIPLADINITQSDVSEIDKVSVSKEMTKSPNIEKSDTFVSDILLEQQSKQSQVFYDSSLSSDMKLIQEAKLETQLETSSTLEEKVHIECMSSTSGAEPTFSPTEMIHESQNVQSEQMSSKEVCLGEEVITSTLTQAYALESNSEDQIISGTALKSTQVVSDVDILKTSDFKIMETRSVEILDSELSEYISISDSSKSNELSFSDISSEIKSKELTLSPEDRIIEEFSQPLATPTPQTETVDHISTTSCDMKDDFSFISTDATQKSTLYSVAENLKYEADNSAKSVEIVDFKGDLSKIHLESIPKTTSIETIPVSIDEDSKEQAHLTMALEDTDFSGCKTGQNIESGEKSVISAKQIDVDDEKYKCEIVDFKGTVSVGEEYVSFKNEETSVVLSKEIDLKFIQGDKIVSSCDITTSPKTVDFKGTKTETSCEPLEIVDFKIITGSDITETESAKELTGFPDSDKLKYISVAETESSIVEKIKTFQKKEVLKPIELTKPAVIKESLTLQTEKDFHKAEDFEVCEVVDFKFITDTDITETEPEKLIIDFPEKTEKIKDTSVAETESTIVEKIKTIEKEEVLKPIELTKPAVIKEPLTLQKKRDFHKAEDSEVCEVVDFKIITSTDITEPEPAKQIIDFPEKVEKINYSSVAEPGSTIVENIKTIEKEEIIKPVELTKPAVTKESLTLQKEIDFHKAEDSEVCEVVDFKGLINAAHYGKQKSVVEDVTVHIPNVKFSDKIETGELKSVSETVMPKGSEQTGILEVVDFKCSLSADELKIQSDDKIIKDAPTTTKLERHSIKIEPLKEVVDFKGTIDSSCPDIGILEKRSEAITYDSQETSYSYSNEQDTMIYDRQEMYDCNVDKQAVIFDPREAYGYSCAFDEQAGICEPQDSFLYEKVIEEREVFEQIDSQETFDYNYDFDQQPIIYESQPIFQYGVMEESQVSETQRGHYEEMAPSEAVSYVTSAEGSAELYSCAETLSAASDTSLQFHSFSHDLEDTANVSTSEDFTDVPSHLTSTEGSDKWSDVEGDFSLEDVEYTRDKTPTRTPFELITSVKEESKSHTDSFQLNENLTMSFEIKDESTFSDSEKFLMSASELVTTDLSSTKFEEDKKQTVSGSEKVKEAEESEICTVEAIKQLEKSVQEIEIIDQIRESIKAISDIEIEPNSILTPLTEHFADIQSLRDPSTTAPPFIPIDIEKAVPKMHEDVSSGISSEPEKTESERWLEAETENSISELSEDIAVCVQEDGETKFIFVDYEKPAECFAKTSEPSETPHTSSTSSSSYSDFETSDHTSDTYADISLQGATTESSDKWSDFENEGLNDDIIFDNIEIPETVEITDFSQLIKKPTPSPDNLKDIQSFETAVDISTTDVKMESMDVKILKDEASDLLKESESAATVKSTQLISDNVIEFDQTVPTDTSAFPSSTTAKLVLQSSEEEFTDVTPLEVTAESDKLSDISDDTSLGEIEDEGSVSLKANLKMQDQELGTISSESKVDSFSKIEETESVNVQLNISKDEHFDEKSDKEISVLSNTQLQDSRDTLSCQSTQVSRKEQDISVVEVSEKLDEKLAISIEESAISKKEEKPSLYYIDTTKVKDVESSLQSMDSSIIKCSEIFPEQVKIFEDVKEISSEKDIQALKADSKLDSISTDSKHGLSETKLSHLVEEKSDSKLNIDTKTKAIITKESTKLDLIDQTESKIIAESYLKDKIDVEDSSSSKITDDSETLDNFTDVPTHTITSETSDAYLDLESDHSFEEIENLQIEGENAELQEDKTADIPSLESDIPRDDTAVIEQHENYLLHKDVLEDTNDFALDAIPENEFEDYEEEEYSLSEHFEINEDELIYPLPYNDDWIEQSFELKEYGVEAEFYESESDIHGLGIVHEVHEEYDDEDIQRAIDYNLSTFEEDEGNVEHVITTESFKTLSHDSSPHLKPDEYETWSTADAPSIEEEFAEQDNVLSKIDEILAEDFGDIYQADSPYLKHDEDIKDYLQKGISPTVEKCDDFIQSDKISLPKFDLEATHEATKIDTVHDELNKKQSIEKVLKTELDTELEISQKKDSSGKEIINGKIKAGEKSSLKTDSEIKTAAVTVQEDFSHICKTISDSVKKTDETPAISEESSTKAVSVQKIDSKSISDKTVQKAFSEVSETESDMVLSDISVEKSTAQTVKPDLTSLSSEITVKEDHSKTLKEETEELSCELSIKKDSKLEINSDELTLKKNIKKVSKTESDTPSKEMISDKDSMRKSTTEVDSTSNEIALKKSYAGSYKTQSEEVCSEVSIKRGSEPESKPESETVSAKILKKNGAETFQTEFESVSGVITLKKEPKSEVKQVSETMSDEITVKKISDKDSKTEAVVVSSEETLKKGSIKESKIKSESLCEEITAKKDFETALKTEVEIKSEEINLQKESKTKLETVSDIVANETLKKVSEKDSRSDSDIVSNEITLKKESKVISESVSGEIIIKKDSAQIFKSEQDSPKEDKTLLKSTDKISEQISSIEETSHRTDILTKSSELSIESKDISSEDVSTVTVISSIDKSVKDQFTDSAKLLVSRTDTSADIPLTKSEETKKEPSVSCKISKEPEVSEPHPSSLLSETVKHSIKSASESAEVQLNIPEQKVHKDETSDVTDITSKEQTFDPLVVEVKPDIPKKTKQKSLDLTETTPIKEELNKKPSLPPKKSKRHSLTDSASSSPGDSLSSSSSAESLSSFESAVSDKSKKSSDETSMHSLSPDVPTRRSRSSKPSSSRSASRDSEDSSSCSRSSSLKIRRRSSNFAELEPIDLSKKRASIDERMKKLQIEGKCTTKEKAFIAAKLIEMQFEEEDALLASRQCNTVYHAVKFLTQLCDMCNCRFPINLMSSLVHCTHRACKECLKAHFTSLIYDRSVFTLLCPICHKPDITDQNIQEYFTHLDMTLTNILEDKVYDLFQRKLRDEVLTKDPNFHWCSQCSSGFIASPRVKKLYCPDCSAITCAMCHQTWELEHEGVHCERFQQWKDMHTPEPPPAGLVKFLIDRGISCPSCGLVYAQACGGCMIYKCSHCSFEFCGFCVRPLKKGRECSNEICDTRGHHIHHLHNCLFFIRDKDITEIQMLLEEESVTYLTIPPKNQIVKTRCQVREQKNNHGVLTEDRCGRSIDPYCGGLCRTHYYEYLAELLRKNNISPLSIMTIQDLQFMLRKSRIFVPEKVKGETSEDYYERLLEFVTKSLT